MKLSLTALNRLTILPSITIGQSVQRSYGEWGVESSGRQGNGYSNEVLLSARPCVGTSNRRGVVGDHMENNL